jgi:nitrogen fixation/metabolism regulation signal transduction histidine kinase
MQHLLRVHRDRRPDFDRTLEDTSARILAEIDRLDTIARAFSRFGAPAESAAPLEPVDLTGTASEVVQLYRLAEEGAPLLDRLGPEWGGFVAAVRRFLRQPDAEVSAELEANGRRISFQLASLGPEVRGVVIALNNVCHVSRAERVVAWGEMARQVAHEIKNPLTPMRLGLQHLRRVYRDRRADFDRTLEDTADRMLAEIDRLDTIARAFSRFAAPAAEDEPLERVDLAAAVGEVVQLYRLTEEGCAVRLTSLPGAVGAARADEVKEVVVNLLENARNAGARVVDMTVGPGRITVADDGSGIPAELLPRIFEPRFSTTTSGSGLGLAIVRRLVEGWGGRIEVESELGRGTTIAVTTGA